MEYIKEKNESFYVKPTLCNGVSALLTPISIPSVPSINNIVSIAVGSNIFNKESNNFYEDANNNLSPQKLVNNENKISKNNVNRKRNSESFPTLTIKKKVKLEEEKEYFAEFSTEFTNDSFELKNRKLTESCRSNEEMNKKEQEILRGNPMGNISFKNIDLSNLQEFQDFGLEEINVEENVIDYVFVTYDKVNILKVTKEDENMKTIQERECSVDNTKDIDSVGEQSSFDEVPKDIKEKENVNILQDSIGKNKKEIECRAENMSDSEFELSSDEEDIPKETNKIETECLNEIMSDSDSELSSDEEEISKETKKDESVNIVQDSVGKNKKEIECRVENMSDSEFELNSDEEDIPKETNKFENVTIVQDSSEKNKKEIECRAENLSDSDSEMESSSDKENISKETKNEENVNIVQDSIGKNKKELECTVENMSDSECELSSDEEHFAEEIKKEENLSVDQDSIAIKKKEIEFTKQRLSDSSSDEEDISKETKRNKKLIKNNCDRKIDIASKNGKFQKNLKLDKNNLLLKNGDNYNSKEIITNNIQKETLVNQQNDEETSDEDDDESLDESDEYISDSEMSDEIYFKLLFNRDVGPIKTFYDFLVLENRCKSFYKSTYNSLGKLFKLHIDNSKLLLKIDNKIVDKTSAVAEEYRRIMNESYALLHSNYFKMLTAKIKELNEKLFD